MIYKQKAIEVNTGILSAKEANRNFYVNVTLNRFARQGNYWIWGAEYQRKTTAYREWQIPLESYLGEVGYSVQLLSDAKKFITLNVGLTGVGGYEIVNKGDSLLLDGAKLLDENNFIYGTGGRLSLETYLSDRVVLMLQGRIRVLWGTDLEQFRPSTGIGFRFNF
ncbi:conjugal transfer protein TraO [Sphingobacterium sp. SRCM116780]|uniref:conjugal transfer protein TraO n=1 Tax=Sphingobacterium sp. SRCM116780 TaxID=2907623 RepID=UPI001F316527|nr:conjugal transfer protein TraO [Sphingobacterium sp. SRCM116780]UIR57835.1 conjugal transfer protein TraO [Sphingobacterium sp. SRCM116780]